MADIFLSYAREDSTRAQILAEKLELHGWSVWWDRRIPHGKDFTAVIQQELDDARCILVLWSKASVAAPYVRNEAREGLNGRLVPLLLEAVKQPLDFRHLQAADLTDWTGVSADGEFARLIESVAAIVPSKAKHEAWGPFSYDLYISYARLDDVPSARESEGWVATFVRTLEIRLGQLLLRQPDIWVNPKGSSIPTDGDFEALRQAAVLVAVVSPRYVRSEWAARELQEFSKAAEQYRGIRVEDSARVFKVVKTPMPLEWTPDVLEPLAGYEFFEVDDSTEPPTLREFNRRLGSQAMNQFFLRLDDLAQDIKASLEELRPSAV